MEDPFSTPSPGNGERRLWMRVNDIPFRDAGTSWEMVGSVGERRGAFIFSPLFSFHTPFFSFTQRGKLTGKPASPNEFVTTPS
jgi:hypothetical protein